MSEGSDSGATLRGPDLELSLAGLSGLFVGSLGLEETLTKVADLAVSAIPGAEGAGLTLLETNKPQIVVATSEFVRNVDGIQYRLDEGPCVSAVAQRRTVFSGNLGGEPQWPHFGPRVGRLGVHSALSLPLLLGELAIGAMNIYAHGRDVFTEDAIAIGEAFAGPAAVSVANAQLLAQAHRLVTQLEQALTSRAEIDQAVGVLMSRTGGSAGEAMDSLRRMSQSQDIKLAEVARTMVAEAAGRARARHSNGDQR